MTASKFLVVPILTCILLLIDWYVWQAVKTVFPTQGIIKIAYWTVTILIVLGLWAYNFLSPDLLGRGLRTFILYSLFTVYASKLFSILFILIDDVRRLVTSRPTTGNNTDTMTRSGFLMKAALLAGSVPATALTWGILSGAHDYRVQRVRLAIRNLPSQFAGMTIVQISDIHSGSFFNKTAVKGGVELVIRQNADVVFFTGDLVNDRASEVRDYIDLFSKIRAPLGVYSILGNHDYGVYTGWGSAAAKNQNFADVKDAHRILGYDLLIDDNRSITLGGETLAIVGVQNISATESIFPNGGNLAKAIKGTDEASVKFLLSHDPTHWDMEVNTNFPEIDVMFSGHTHGLQLGVTIGGKTYSPAQWRYKQWAGLYKKDDQQLYVNRGFGYLGFPGRVGMPPEITVFELTRATPDNHNFNKTHIGHGACV